MISKSLALKVLNESLATGGDYAELYLEENNSQDVTLENGKVETAGTRKRYGAGLRILNKFQSVYGYTSDLSAKSLLTLAHSLAASYHDPRQITVEKIQKQRVKTINVVTDHLMDVPVKEKVALLKESYEAASVVDKRIVRFQDSFSNYEKKIEIFSAEGNVGKQYENSEERGRLYFVAVASDNGKIETGYVAPGRYAGWHFFSQEIDHRALAKQAARRPS